MFKTVLLGPALKDCISKLNNNSICCFNFWSVAISGFLLILPQSHRVTVLCQTSWLMRHAFAPHLAVCGSEFMTSQLKPTSHEKGEKPSQGRKHSSLFPYIHAQLCIPCRLLRDLSHVLGMISDSTGSFSILLASLICNSFD